MELWDDAVKAPVGGVMKLLRYDPEGGVRCGVQAIGAIENRVAARA